MEIGDNTEEPSADDQRRADEAVRLASGHTPSNNRDDTGKVLRAFIQHLPLAGQRHIVADVLAHGDDGCRLRD